MRKIAFLMTIIMTFFCWNFAYAADTDINIQKKVGDNLYVFEKDRKIGICNSDDKIIIESKYSKNCSVGFAVNGIFTVRDNNKYDVYSKKGELIKSIENPLGFDIKSGIDGKPYEIVAISGGNIVLKDVKDVLNESKPSQDWFIINLIDEKKIADNFFKIQALPNGKFTAIGIDDLKGYVLNSDGSIMFKSIYGELVYSKPLNYFDDGFFAAYDIYNCDYNRIENDDKFTKLYIDEDCENRVIYKNNKYNINSLVDKDGNHIIDNLIKNIGEDLYIFENNGKKGIADKNGIVIVQPEYNENCRVGSVVDGLFTIRDDDKYDIYNIRGELIKSIEKPLGLSHRWGDSEIAGKDRSLFNIGAMSGTNVVVYEHPGDMCFEIFPGNDFFIVRLMSEKISADDFFSISTLPNGEFYAINDNDHFAYILNKDGSPKLKTNYGELNYYKTDCDGKILFAAFKEYDTFRSYKEREEDGESYDIIDIYGNVIEKNVKKR